MSRSIKVMTVNRNGNTLWTLGSNTKEFAGNTAHSIQQTGGRRSRDYIHILCVGMRAECIHSNRNGPNQMCFTIYDSDCTFFVYGVISVNNLEDKIHSDLGHFHCCLQI